MSEQSQFVVFSLLEPKFCVAKLGADADLRSLPIDGEFVSITKSGSDVSLVCEEERAPKGVDLERNWRCLKVQGPLEFSLKGVLVSLLGALRSRWNRGVRGLHVRDGLHSGQAVPLGGCPSLRDKLGIGYRADRGPTTPWSGRHLYRHAAPRPT